MDKNTVWAIVLSTIVIIAAYFVTPLFFGNKDAVAEETASEIVIEKENVPAKAEVSNSIFSESEIAVLEGSDEEVLSEEKITFNTNHAEIVFTTKGGDILSYKLKNHIDMDTQEGVQISDNVNELNRTCALALGGADNKIIDEVFAYEMVNENTILFKKNFSVTDKNGNRKSFMLGKKYTFNPDDFMFKLDILIHSNDGSGLDFNGAAYTLRTSPQIGPHYDPKQNKYENRQFVAYNGKKAKKLVLSNGQFKRYDKEVLWGGIAGKYFIELVVPGTTAIWNSAYYSSKVEVNDYANAQALFERTAFTGSDIQDTYYMYFGPRNEKDLKKYNVADNNPWRLSGNRLTESLQSSGMLSWLETILKWCLEMLHKIIPNWGVCIIVVTIVLKVVLFPLSIKQSKSTMKMQALQPKLQAIQKKYADDQQKMQTETQKIYQEAGYNPASGCLPMIFQFVVLIAMYNLFNNYFEFRGSMFIPKWIPDLTVGDSVYKFKFNLPLLGNQLRLLPIIYVATQIISTKITQVGTPQGQNNMNMKMMTYGMPILFFFLFYNAPSGLLLYWLTSNIWQVGQQLVINKMMATGKIKDDTNTKKLPPKGKKK